MTLQTRPLSASERIFFAMDQLYSPFVNQLVLEGSGNIDVDRWHHAVIEASEANPGCRLVLRGRLGWSRLVDCGENPPVRVVDAPDWSGSGPEGAEFLRQPLPIREGPSCEVVLVPGETSRVVVRTHHITMDGGGTLHWARDIFNALNDRPLIGSQLGQTDTQLAKTMDTRGTPPWNRIYPAATGAAEGDDCSITWRRVQVPGSFSMLLPRVALYVAQCARQSSGDSIHIAIPVDMRRHTPVAHNTGNLTGFIHIMVAGNSTPDDITRQIKDKLAQREYAALNPGTALVTHLPLRLISGGIEKSATKMRQDGLFGGSAVLSNLGRLDVDSLSSPDFSTRTGFFIPPGTGVSPTFMALSGSQAGTELVAAMPACFASNRRLDGFLLGLADFLQAP